MLSVDWTTRTRIYTGLDSIEWYEMYGSDCKGGGEDAITHEKMRWLQLLKDIDCTLTSTWTINEDNCEFHTWRAWEVSGLQKTARLHHEPEGHMLYDLVPE